MVKPDFYIFDEITPDMAKEFAEKLLSIKKKQCSIWVSSLGGEIESAMAMAAVLDTLRRRHISIHIHIASIAYSSAAYLLQLADKRTIAPHACMMIHHAYSETSPDKTERYSAREHFYQYQVLKAYSDSMFKAISKRSGITISEIEQKIAQNEMQWFLTAEEIIEYNLADEVIDFAHFVSKNSKTDTAIRDSDGPTNVISIESSKPAYSTRRKKHVARSA